MQQALATWGTRPCCPSCWTRSRPNRRSPASQPMVLSTRASAMTRSLPAEPRRSSHPARTPNHGRQTPQVLSRATRSFGHQNASVERSGDDGAVITAEAALKPRCDLRQAPRAAPVRARLRPSGCRVPGQSRRPQRLYRPQHAPHRGRRIALSGEREGLPVTRFVQQSRLDLGSDNHGAQA